MSTAIEINIKKLTQEISQRMQGKFSQSSFTQEEIDANV